ncbi:MAG: hypothetical protein QGG72_05220 [Verrucomicrobiota bacterium]|nr:hypothetical protein [Verrucomicrobiota bacterium]
MFSLASFRFWAARLAGLAGKPRMAAVVAAPTWWLVRFAGFFFAGTFATGAFFAAGFFAAAFLAEAFLAGAFLADAFFTAFLAVFAVFFATFRFAATILD